jgi:hypothetical protein
MKRLLILIFSLVYAAIVLTAFTADRLRYFADERADERAEESDYVTALGLIDKAIMLDPENADLYFRKYEIVSDLIEELEKVSVKEGSNSDTLTPVPEGDDDTLTLAPTGAMTLTSAASDDTLTLSLSPEDLDLTIHHLQKQQLSLIKRAIDLRPTWPTYHVLYAHTLGRMSRNPNYMTRRVILSELEKAAELKPYSPTYRKIYRDHVNSYK